MRRPTNIRIDTTRRGAWPRERKLTWAVPAMSVVLLVLALAALVLVRACVGA